MGKHKGFTLIEITLFLAVTTALFIGVGLGVNNSIFQQQYNDTTQSFLEFLRSIYSEVSNPQSVGKGNSDYAIYGKMIVFGETVDLLGKAVPSDEQQVFVYDVIGGATTNNSGDIKTLLNDLDANVAFVSKKSDGTIRNITLASPEKYTPHWNMGIETLAKTEMKETILVVRHPRSGTINTLVYNDAIQVNKVVSQAQGVCIAKATCNTVTQLLKSRISGFEPAEVDFCINPYGLGGDSDIPRRNIRILENARNASSVQLMELNGANNECAKV